MHNILYIISQTHMENICASTLEFIIIPYLANHDICNLELTSRIMHNMVKNMPYTSMVNVMHLTEKNINRVTWLECDYELIHENGFTYANENKPINVVNMMILSNMPNLRKLNFGTSVNGLAYSLTNSLTHLTFGTFFNEPIMAGMLPRTLTHLVFGQRFNQQLISVLPESLKSLTLGCFLTNH